MNLKYASALVIGWLVTCVVFFWAGILIERGSGEYRSAPRPVAVAASVSAGGVLPQVHVLPMPPVPVLSAARDIPPPAGMTDPDMEVCRSINTTCAGAWPQDRCRKSKTSWSAILSASNVNCVVAAQGLVSREDRASWIRSCGAGINCW